MGSFRGESRMSMSVSRILQYLLRWILSPQSIRYNTTMPALTGAILDRETATEELIAYLKAMSNAKRVPANP